MGTIGEWIEVIGITIFFGGAMLFLETSGISAAGNKRRSFTFENTLIYGSFGLMAGLWSVFHWRAFRWPLALFSALPVIGAILLVVFFRPKASANATKNSVPSR